MTGEWMTAEMLVGDIRKQCVVMYAVYRVLETEKIDCNSNREYFPYYFKDPQKALEAAAKMQCVAAIEQKLLKSLERQKELVCTIPTAANHMGVTTATVYRWIREEKLPILNPKDAASSYRIRCSDLKVLVEILKEDVEKRYASNNERCPIGARHGNDS